MPYPFTICCWALDGWFSADGHPGLLLGRDDLMGDTIVGLAGAMNDVFE